MNKFITVKSTAFNIDKIQRVRKMDPAAHDITPPTIIVYFGTAQHEYVEIRFTDGTLDENFTARDAAFLKLTGQELPPRANEVTTKVTTK